MNSNQAAEEIIKNLKNWSPLIPRLVVAIDGISGVGKSTVMDLMKGKIEALLVHMDDFLTPIEYRQALVDKGVNPDEWVADLFDYPDIKNLIETYKKGEQKNITSLAYKSGKRQLEKTYDLIKPILVIEGTFMFNPQYFDDLWDKRIYLDANEEEIRQRRIERVKGMMGENYIPENDPRSFYGLNAKALEKYQERCQPKQKADLVLTVTPQELIKPAVLYHASQNRNIEVLEPKAESIRHPHEGPVVFATVDKPYQFLVPSGDGWTKKVKFNDVSVHVISDRKRYEEVDKGGAIYYLDSTTFNNEHYKYGGGRSEWTSKVPVKPFKKEEYESGLQAQLEGGVQVFFVDKEIFDQIVSSSDHGKSILKTLKSENSIRGINPKEIPD